MVSTRAEQEPGERVVAVVVAYNRADLLERTLGGLAGQTRPLDAVVVVDNASTDDSAERSARQPVVTEVVRLPRNTGGAGGFAAGIARALERHHATLVWVMDDDTVPAADALAALLHARANYPGTPVLLASRADWHDGREHPMNTPRERPFVSPVLRRRAAGVGARHIRSASFVSVLVDARIVRERGLPVASYFLWNDDFEYTARLLRRRVGLYVPASRVFHLTRVFGASDADPGPRFFNEVRNKVWVFTRSSALGPLDRVLYAGATVLRWCRTIRRAQDRSAMVRLLWKGLNAGLTPPVTNVEVFRDTPVAEDVAAVERGVLRA